MTDTSPEVQALHHRLLMARSNEERFLMGVSMCRSVRAVVWSTIDEDLPESERRARYLRRYYDDELTPADVAAVAAWEPTKHDP